MTTTAQDIRNEIKKAGYKTNQVSVRTRRSTYTLTIKQEGISFAEIKGIASAAERIDRCEATGEILVGGNTYTYVEHHEAVKAAKACELKDAYEKALSQAVDSSIIKVEGTDLYVSQNRYGSGAEVWGESTRITEVYDVTGFAAVVLQQS